MNDTVVESNGVKIVYESRIANMLNGFVIEYSNSFFSKGFYLELLRSSK